MLYLMETLNVVSVTVTKKKKISKTQSLSCFRIKNKQYSPCPLEHVWEPGQIKTKYMCHRVR